MDLDAYVLAHCDDWVRLEELTKRRRLSGVEVDEFVDRYQLVATHLSVVRERSPDPQLIAYLSSLLSRARIRSVGARSATWGGVRTFALERFPAALWRLRWWCLGTLLGNAVALAVMMMWLLDNPAVEQSLLSPEAIDQLVTEDFEGYYSEYAASQFAARVWINNVWVSALCIALGVLVLPVFYLLFTNLANIAVSGVLMTRHGYGEQFWGLILPHGLLELTAVFVAAAVGLRLGWSWIEPGDVTRLQGMAREGRTAGTVALGLVLVLAVSGLIEGFVTPSGLPTWTRVGIGVLAELAFLTYVVTLGRETANRGHTGDVDPRLLESRVASQG